MTEAPRPCFHSCIHHKHLRRAMDERGFQLIARKEAVPADRAALCINHLGGGDGGGGGKDRKAGPCVCTSPWRVVPSGLTALLGGKVSMARLLASEHLSSLGPDTYISIEGWRSRPGAADEAGDGAPVKWFVKVSHQCSRRGMLCTTDPAAVEAHVAALPPHHRYVIQREVPAPLLIAGRKVILRVWALLTISADTMHRASLHFSRRLRVNRLRSDYDAAAAGHDADLAHDERNAFADTRGEWALYGDVWGACVAASEKVLRRAVDVWREDRWPGRRRAAWAAEPTSPPPGGGWLNVFALDFVPSCAAGGGAPRPMLLEVNVDPGFQNKCSETTGVAEDLTDFCFEAVGRGEKMMLPDEQFHSIHIPLPAAAATGAAG